MEENILVNIMMIKNMELELIIGLNMVMMALEKFIVDNGKMENKMDLDIIKIQQVFGKKVFGCLEKEKEVG